LGRALTFGTGWHPRPEDGVRWANDDAVMSYFNPCDQPLAAELRLELLGVAPREIVLEQNGRRVHSIHTGDRPVELVLPRFDLAPGVNTFVLRSAEPAKRLGSGRYQLRTFGLKSSSIKIISNGMPVDVWAD
jgi:hypothetical protein